jgi:hypothetical protein
VNVAPETCRAKKRRENKLDLLHLVGILFINPRCTETRNSMTWIIFGTTEELRLIWPENKDVTLRFFTSIAILNYVQGGVNESRSKILHHIHMVVSKLI